MIEYSILELDEIFVTQGLNTLVTKEFLVNKGNYSINDVRLIIDYIITHLNDSNRVINNNETFSCGSWLIQFIIENEYIKILELEDLDKNGNNIFDFSLSTTIRIYKEQFELCESKGVLPFIPRINQKIAISEDIYSGSEVNAVRYESPNHMSGWYLTSNNYDGEINSLKVDYLFYIIKRRGSII